MKSTIKINGHGIFELRRKDGTVIERWEKDNTISDTGKIQVAKLLNGIDTVYFRAIAVGVDTPSATALGSENQRAEATLTYLATAKAVFEKTFTFGSAYAITEAGVFNQNTIGGIMLDSFSFTAKNVNTETNLYVKITVSISA